MKAQENLPVKLSLKIYFKLSTSEGWRSSIIDLNISEAILFVKTKFIWGYLLVEVICKGLYFTQRFYVRILPQVKTRKKQGKPGSRTNLQSYSASRSTLVDAWAFKFVSSSSSDYVFFEELGKYHISLHKITELFG